MEIRVQELFRNRDAFCGGGAYHPAFRRFERNQNYVVLVLTTIVLALNGQHPMTINCTCLILITAPNASWPSPNRLFTTV